VSQEFNTVQQWFPKCAPRTLGIRDQFLGDPWIHFCNGCFEVYVFFSIQRIKYCLKESLRFINWRYVYFVWPLEHVIKKLPVPTKLVTVVIKAETRQAFLQVLLVCICSYFKSFQRYTFWNFGYLFSGRAIFMWARMWGSLVIFRSQKGPGSKNVWETLQLSMRAIIWFAPLQHSGDSVHRLLWHWKLIALSTHCVCVFFCTVRFSQ